MVEPPHHVFDGGFFRGAAERGGDTLKGLADFRPENGSSQGQDPALTVSCAIQGYLAHKKTPTPLGTPQGPGHGPTVGWGRRFLRSEVPLYLTAARMQAVVLEPPHHVFERDVVLPWLCLPGVISLEPVV